MTYVLTAEQMRAVDRAATDAFGVPTLLLMENAGRGVAELVARELLLAGALETSLAGRRVRVVCGGGSNGGDGFVAARHLALAGADVRVLLAVPREKIEAAGGDAAAALRALLSLGLVPVLSGATWDPAGGGAPGTPDSWAAALGDAEAVVDAIFGTGLRSDVTGPPAVAIAAMNGAPGIKIAVDIPSGVEADSGRFCGTAFRADVTATMGARKLGFTIDPEAPAGRVEVISLGVPIARPPRSARSATSSMSPTPWRGSRGVVRAATRGPPATC